MKDRRRPSIVWRVNITLRYVTPAVWRAILVRPDTKLATLHRYIQAAMGWLDYHLFVFNLNGKRYTIPSRNLDIKAYDARRYRLDRLLSEPSGHLEYVYDFGDWWEHDVPEYREFKRLACLIASMLTSDERLPGIASQALLEITHNKWENAWKELAASY